MDTDQINKLVDEYNGLMKERENEEEILLLQKNEIESKIDKINEKYSDRINKIDAELMHILYLARHNLTEVHMHFMLKDAAEVFYATPSKYTEAFYDGMRIAFELFLQAETIKEIDAKAHAKYPNSNLNY